VRDAIEALGEYVVPDAGARLLTTSGVERSARGHDAALIDVAHFASSPIGVVDCLRPGWDAAALARAWGERFVRVDASVLRHVDEHRLPDADFAARHDDEARLRWLADRLREAMARASGAMAALVLPPCLGIEKARARALSGLVGVPCGEAIGLPGGPSGLRFERARERAFSALGIARLGARVTALSQDGGDRWRVTTDDDRTTVGDAVVLALGGLIGGGLEYCPAESMAASALPPFARPSFGLTIDAPVTIGADGARLEMPSSLFGDAAELLAWPFCRGDATMDRVGVLTDQNGCAGPRVFAAGDLRADRPRTWLDALATGAAAGQAAARCGPSAFVVRADR